MNVLGWLLGLENLSSIDAVEARLSAPWAQERPFLLALGLVAAVVATFVFYLKFQNRGSLAARMGLAVCRSLILVLLLVTLADPILQLTSTSFPRPVLYVLFDGTESMGLVDQFSAEESRALREAAGVAPAAPEASPPEKLSRLDLVRAWVARPTDNVFEQLQHQQKVRIEAYVFEGQTTSHLRKLTAGESAAHPDWSQLADQLSATGQVTALGSVFGEISRQSGANKAAGVVLVGDFSHNSGPPPLGGQAGQVSPLQKLGLPIYTVGIGATEAKDLAVSVKVLPTIMKNETGKITVEIEQTGCEGETASVSVVAVPLAHGSELASGEPQMLGEKQVSLTGPRVAAEFPYTPSEAGRFRYEARVAPHEAEVVLQNNEASREATVIDDYLRLMYVAFEPDWEWRFIKEVFQRDKRVGAKGFRTYLASSDPRIREQNELFLRTLTQNRGDFFRHDILFLSDLPRAELKPQFCRMAKEFVENFGGGLVVIAGPRFGPRELLGTEIAEMLPVVIDANGRLRDEQEFKPRLTPAALSGEFTFMQLTKDPKQNVAAWANLGRLPWYQPVERIVTHRNAAVLLEHPVDKTSDGKSQQPLLAVGSYGSRGGQVVYVGFNEMWRLRKEFGERYYREFWYQLMDRLTMSHALGEEKRFLVRANLPECRVGDRITVSAEAYDANYQPLEAEKTPGGVLEARHAIPAGEGQTARDEALYLSPRTPGNYEFSFEVTAPGLHQVSVTNPLTGKAVEVQFRAITQSAEHRQATRDSTLQREIAQQSGGKSYELTNVANLANDLQVAPQRETLVRNFALWSTPLWFALVVALLLGEWLCRKLIRLT